MQMFEGKVGKMLSLRAVLIELRLLDLSFEEALDKTGVSEADIKRLRNAIAVEVLETLVRSGREVVEDYQFEV